MKIRCSKCNFEDEGNFCSNCGAVLQEKTITKEKFKPINQVEDDIEYWLTRLREGKSTISIGGEAPVILKRDEVSYTVIMDIHLIEPRSIRTGMYGGPSLRLTKFLGITLGGFCAESHEELEKIDKGVLVLTNKRVIFCGSKRSVNIDLRKIISIEPFKDAIAVKRVGRDKPQYFMGIDKIMLVITVGDEKYERPLSGRMMKYQIEGVIKQLQ